MDPTTHRRVFKVSKELDRLALQCEQHKLQMAHRRGLPDWTHPSVPAGIPTGEHERVPAFFAWERTDPPPGFQVAERVLSAQNDGPALMDTPTRAVPSAEDRPAPRSELWTSTPVRHLPEPSEPVSPPSAGAAPSIPNTPVYTLPEVSASERGVTPERPSTIDLTTPRYAAETPTPGMVTPVRPTRRPLPPPVSVPVYNSSAPLLLSPTSTTPSPRYKHGRRLREIDMARPSSADSYRSTPAGISTVAADRFKKRPSFRSPDWAQRRPNKRLAFLDSQVRLAEEEHRKADRDATSVGDRHWDNRIAQSLNERRKHFLSGSDAQRVAKRAAREFLHEDPQENTVENSQLVEGVYVGPTVITSETPRKRKPASIDEAVQVDLGQPTKPTVRVADRTTQTDEREAQPAAEVVTPPAAESAHPSAAVASTTRSSKAPRASASPQLANPILMNPRYPPEPSAFRAQTTYRLEFGENRTSR